VKAIKNLHESLILNSYATAACKQVIKEIPETLNNRNIKYFLIIFHFCFSVASTLT